MGALFSLLLLAVPSLLVAAAFYFWSENFKRLRTALGLLLGAVWAIAAWFWASYAQQQTDVGLMIEGIFASATTVSALLATLLAAVLLWRR